MIFSGFVEGSITYSCYYSMLCMVHWILGHHMFCIFNCTPLPISKGTKLHSFKKIVKISDSKMHRHTHTQKKMKPHTRHKVP